MRERPYRFTRERYDENNESASLKSSLYYAIMCDVEDFFKSSKTRDKSSKLYRYITRVKSLILNYIPTLYGCIPRAVVVCYQASNCDSSIFIDVL